jgi:putative acetyltransferase
MPLSIRAYQADDLDDVIAIFLVAIRETASRDYDRDQVDAWARADRDVWARRRAAHPTWVAESDGRPIGFTDMEADGHVDMLYVDPRFQRRGVAGLLLQAVEDFARSKHVLRLYSEVSLTARPAFERAGFVVVTPERVFRNGQWFDRFQMDKQLT